MDAAQYYPGFRGMHAKWYPQDIIGPVPQTETGRYWFVDGDKAASGAGRRWEDAYKTIQEAVTAAGAGDVIYVAAKTITALATDPVSYAENIIIPNATSSLSIIGISRGRTQGGMPQIKPGGTTASTALTIRAPGCLIANLGFNGISTAVSPAVINMGIVLDDDGGATSVAFGTSIVGCHFKNCAGSTITNASTGGAINWSSDGGAWQILIKGNRFYKNVGDVVLPATALSVPQDVVIEDNIFSGPIASVDCNLFLTGGGSGINGLIIRNNVFPCTKPTLGTVAKYMDLTGCVGILANNQFACLTSNTSTEGTFAAAGTLAFVPTTVYMAGNNGETHITTELGHVFRT